VCIFFIFGKVKSASIQLTSSTLFPLPYDKCGHDAAPCHSSFSLNQDEFIASASSFSNALFYHLLFQLETKSLNPHHHSRPPSLNRLAPTLYYYKKIISILITLTTTQSYLHFTSSLARAPRNRSSTHHRRSLSSFSCSSSIYTMTPTLIK
jgi:hypothetical protein